jgi:hypothetical protein
LWKASEGFVISRQPLHTWIYPWVKLALVVAMLGVLGSALWTVGDVRDWLDQSSTSQ